MMSLLVALLVLYLVCGRTRGLLGGLVGGFLGAFVLVGMATTARNGELAALYTPSELASSAVPVAVVAAAFALVAPYATGVAALGWAAGALLAAIAAPRTGDAIYILPLAVHVIAATAVATLARAAVKLAILPPRARPPRRWLALPRQRMSQEDPAELHSAPWP